MGFDYCKNCSRYEHCGMRIPCGHFEPKKPKTNFARITSSPESLADFISKVTIAAWFAQANSELPNPNGSREWLAWLKQENEEK